jgi:predicted nucleic acid-binding protein
MATGHQRPQLAVRTWLVDTGPLVAFLDRADPRHEDVAGTLDGFSGRLVTTSAVITEAMHLLAEAREGPESLADFIDATGLRIVEMMTPAAIRHAVDLMRKYGDTPMDFADATLGDPQQINPAIVNGEVACTNSPRPPTVGSGGPSAGSDYTLFIALLAGVGVTALAGFGVLRTRANRS